MMRLFFMFYGLVSFSLNAQPDTLNRIDQNGERYGWWIVYLDGNLAEVNDSAEATHCRYTLYNGKFDYYNMGTIGSKKSPVIFPAADTLNLNGLKLLNGAYAANYSNGQQRFILTAENGIFTEYKEYYENGQLMTHFKYTPGCGSPYHCCILTYKKDGTLEYEGTNMTPEDRENN